MDRRTPAVKTGWRESRSRVMRSLQRHVRLPSVGRIPDQIGQFQHAHVEFLFVGTNTSLKVDLILGRSLDAHPRRQLPQEGAMLADRSPF